MSYPNPTSSLSDDWKERQRLRALELEAQKKQILEG